MNKKEAQLIEFCDPLPRTIKEISEYTKVSIKNIWVKVRNLEKEGLVIIKKHKNYKTNKEGKTLVQTNRKGKITKYLIKLLKIIEKKGSISEDEFQKEMWKDGAEPFSREGYYLTEAFSMIEMSKLIKHQYSLTPSGEKFLKENLKSLK